MHVRKTFWGALFLLLVLYVGSQFIKDIAFTRAATVVLLLIVLGFLWAREAVSSIIVTRNAREFRQQAGQIFSEQFVVQNVGRLPKLWLEILDESNIGKTHGSRFITWLRGNSSLQYFTHTVLSRRGIYNLGPTRVIAGDPFGLFYRDVLVSGHENIMVLPYYEPITQFVTPSGYLPGGKALRTRSYEVTPYAIGVRDYQPGDPLRRIDWKSSARFDKLLVKEFEQDPESNVWVFLDASREGNEILDWVEPLADEDKKIGNALYSLAERYKYHLPKIPFEYAMSLTAALCDYFVNSNKSVGLIMDGQGLFKYTPDLGERQLDKLFEAFAIVKPEGTTPFPELIESQITLIPKGSTVILVSTTTDRGISPLIHALKYRNYLPVFIGVNKESFGGSRTNSAVISELQNSGVQTITINYSDPLEKIGELFQ